MWLPTLCLFIYGNTEQKICLVKTKFGYSALNWLINRDVRLLLFKL